MKKRLLALFIAVLLCTTLCLPSFAAFDPDTRNGVVVVAIYFDDTSGNSYALGWGTGFFVGKSGENPTYIVTNHHVVEDFIDLGEGQLVDLTVDGGIITGRAKIRIHYDSRDYEEAYLVGYDEIKDLAIVKLGSPTSKRVSLPIMTPTDSMVGSPAYALGYPGLAENIFADATTSFGKNDCTVTTGTISRLFRTSGTGRASIQLDLEINHGNSGGPLLTENNVVIGINTWGYNGEDGTLKYAVSVEELIPLLNQYSVPYTDGSALPEPEPDNGSTAAPTTETTAPVVTPAPAADFPVWAIILIAVFVVAVVAVVLALALSKKNKPAPQAAAPVQQAAPAQPVQHTMPMQQPRPSAPSKRGGVRSLSSQHRGSVIQVGATPILLGRGADCTVVYGANTPGVSGKHCSLSFDAASGTFTLTDLQSTYGTYLQNGQKLTPNMPYRLRSGDQFYLGEPQNKLQLSVE